MPQTITRVPTLPPTWLTECRELHDDYTGIIEEDLVLDGMNAELYGICRSRHNALVKRLKELGNASEN